MEIIRNETIKKARKFHSCDGVWQLERNVDENDETHKEALNQAKACQNIKKGDSYHKQVQREGGELQEFKSCLGCWEQIEKFKFYDNDY